ADAEEDRLVLAPRGFERRRPPLVPIHRIAGVLLEIRRGSGGEAVLRLRRRGHGGLLRGFFGGSAGGVNWAARPVATAARERAFFREISQGANCHTLAHLFD